VSPPRPTLVSSLSDDERSVRSSTANPSVAIATVDPARVESTVGAFAARLAAVGEFYYARARCTEALGSLATPRTWR